VPVSRTYSDHLTAAHTLAHYHGQELMAAIFGTDAIGELFSTKLGILMSKAAEEGFDKRLFVIVPNLDKSLSLQDIDARNSSNPMEYKIQVLNADDGLMRMGIDPTSEWTWFDLHGQRIEFGSYHRPRARYL
jgi:hypothetical protein